MYNYEDFNQMDIPEALCNCEHCEHYCSSWGVCKLRCKLNSIPTNSKDMDATLYKMDEESDEFKHLCVEENDFCDDFEFDPNTVDDTPDWAEY